MSFRARLTIASAAAVALTIVLGSVLAYVVVRRELRGQIDDALLARAQKVSVPRPDPIGFSLEPPRFGGAGGFAQLVTDDGGVIRGHSHWHGERGEREEPIALPTDGALAVASGSRRAFFTDADIEGTHLRILTAPVVPGVAVQIARPLDEVDDTLHDLALLLGAISFGGVAIAVAAGLVVTRAALAPVRRLTEATEHVTQTGDLTRRIEAAGGDELGRLAANFNAMLATLDRSLGAQRRLVADASHELRTPLTSVRTNVEVLERNPDLDEEERRRVLADLRTELEELTALVGQLVELARGDEPQRTRRAVRLDEIVSDAVERARRRAPAVRFALHAEPTTVEAVPERIETAVSNLLENAAKWSPPGTYVEVGVREGEVTVHDRGPGIPERDLPHVFDRFYRAPAARAVPGSGLGLAIVKQVADEHGGTVTAANAADGGAIVRLRLSPI